MEARGFADYLSYERNCSSRTVSAYMTDLDLFDRFLKSQDESLELENATRDNVRQWVVSMMESGRHSTSVNRRLSSLRTFYRYLVKTGVLQENPASLVQGPKNGKPLPQFVREAQMDDIMDNAFEGSDYKTVRDRTIMAVFYESGLRLAELTGLDVADVDFDTRTLRVTGKRDKQRVIPLGFELTEILKAYIPVRNSSFPACGSALFLDTKGERIPRHQVYRMVKDVLTRHSDVEKKSPHVLRHSFATAMLDGGGDIEAVKDLLGHESLATTQIYTHATFTELKNIYSRAHPRGSE